LKDYVSDTILGDTSTSLVLALVAIYVALFGVVSERPF